MAADTPVDALSEVEAEAELARLAEEIAANDAAYYQQDAPLVSDGEYDAPVSYTHLTLPTKA